jgi:hypothetical protein
MGTLGTAAPAQNDTDTVWRLSLGADGRAALRYGAGTVASLALGAFNRAWAPARAHLIAEQDGLLAADLRVPETGTLACSLRLTPADGGGVAVSALFAARGNADLNSLYAAIEFPPARLAGRTADFGGTPAGVPAEFDGQTIRLWSGRAAAVRLDPAGCPAVTLASQQPLGILFQDDRKWDGGMSVRLGVDLPPNGRLPRGTTNRIDFVLLPSQPVRLDLPRPVLLTAGDAWVPLRPDLEIRPGSALDWSALMPRHRPAGGRGWLTVRPDGRFAFERDSSAAVRFYGVNFCFDAQYPTHEEADKLAERLDRLGYNSVRFHHYERDLMGTNAGVRLALQPDRLDRLDYFFAALRRRGIYATTDLYVSRPVRKDELRPGETGTLDDTSFKLSLYVDDRAVESWCAFARLFLDHRNPYTGLRYADDPALCLISLVNEGNIPNRFGRMAEPERSLFEREWNRFLSGRYPTAAALAAAWSADPGGDPAAGTVPLCTDVWSASPRAADAARFCAALESRLYRRLSAFLRRDMGCRALLTNINGWTNLRSFQAVRAEFDYVDDHLYVGHPSWVGTSWSLPSKTETRPLTTPDAIGGVGMAFCRVPGKPFTVTEFNYAAPGHFRGPGGLATGALAALQDWDGIWRFAYSHRRAGQMEPAPLTYFDLCRDPLNQAADRAMLSLFLRRDARPAPHGLAVALGAGSRDAAGRPDPDWRALALVTRVGAGPVSNAVSEAGWQSVPGTPAGAGGPGAYEAAAGSVAEALLAAAGVAIGNLVDHRRGVYASETGELRLDREATACTVATAGTAGGFRASVGEFAAGAVRVRIDDAPATVWVTSLDGRPIGESRRLLVTHLTDLLQEGARFAEESMTILREWGAGRPLVRAGRAAVDVPVPSGTAKVWGLAVSGERTGTCQATRRGDTLSLPLDVRGPDGARMLYEIEIGN